MNRRIARDAFAAGEIVVQPFNGKPDRSVAGGGLVHDWVGSVFIPGATVEQTLALVQDYNRHKNIYKPEVVDSRILSHEGNDFRIYLRLLKKKVITVQLNTEHEVKYIQLAPKRWRSISRTTKIAEVENAGKPNEREKPPGTGEGFLWRLNSYWRFEERDGGDLGGMPGGLADSRRADGAGLGDRADHPQSAEGEFGEYAAVDAGGTGEVARVLAAGKVKTRSVPFIRARLGSHRGRAAGAVAHLRVHAVL